MDAPLVYNGTLILIFRDALPDLQTGLHETLRQFRFIRGMHAEALTLSLYHVIATTCEMDDNTTIWYSPMGLVKFEEHPYVREALLPHAEAALAAAGRNHASAVGYVALPDGEEGETQLPARRSR